ncbi:MAG TPA: glycosyltransferase family 2 protein [Vitreimonas sp.]|uniref:glycosyltransferase family 2 protein n=1 Tax=Vitreimonas sp. TaxID=3069702 RepID=UPI002D42EB4C|nr:glycosyltransferase family 2 protein [Vitreimonas sp.]HYD88941.1 glycosyltransferase family 2 protein [Vitreimonas sp.]
MPSRVDVIMPAYNAAATVREAVQSLLAQTMRDLRVVVIDDGSTDDTPAILAALSAADGRVLVTRKVNDGIVEARNHALRLCDAEFIACLDADDTAFPDRLERQIAYLGEHPDCVALGGEVDHVDESGAPIEGLVQQGDPGRADPAKAPALEPYIVHSTMLARRAAVVEVGGYRHVPNSEDSDLFWRLQERGALVNLPVKFGAYRVHTASVSSSIVNGRIMAVGSQLGAISALRRRRGATDIAFPRELHASLRAAVTMEKMCAAAARDIEPEEAQHLRIAAAAKLMELARYRPYELDAGDCAFIRAALPLAKQLSRKNQKEVAWYVSVTAARLMRKGMLSEALTLAPPKSYPVAAARALLQL